MRVVILGLLVAACTSRRHEPAHPEDKRRVYVEVNADRSHRRPLRDGAKAGLAKIPFAVSMSVNEGGDVELQLRVARLDVVGRETVCDLKILVLRLPQHELIGMAEGSARAGGTHDEAGDDCIERLGESLISTKVRTLLHKRLGEKQ